MASNKPESLLIFQRFKALCHMQDFKVSQQMLTMTVSSLCFPYQSDLDGVHVTSATKINSNNLYFMTYLKDFKKFVRLQHIMVKVWYFMVKKYGKSMVFRSGISCAANYLSKA